MAKDLRTYLDDLLTAVPDAVKVVEEEVDPEFEATALVHKIVNDENYPGFPAILFKNVKNSPVPLLLNLHGTYDRVARSIDSDMKTMVAEYA
jgi:2,5-furandicarboxylate decarboxylase 1